MIENPVIHALLNHKSIRKYQNQEPTDEEIQTVARCGFHIPGHATEQT
jgi:hypothetical protein